MFCAFEFSLTLVGQKPFSPRVLLGEKVSPVSPSLPLVYRAFVKVGFWAVFMWFCKGLSRPVGIGLTWYSWIWFGFEEGYN